MLQFRLQHFTLRDLDLYLDYHVIRFLNLMIILAIDSNVDFSYLIFSSIFDLSKKSV